MLPPLIAIQLQYQICPCVWCSSRRCSMKSMRCSMATSDKAVFAGVSGSAVSPGMGASRTMRTSADRARRFHIAIADPSPVMCKSR